jgi:hypothetical protein
MKRSIAIALCLVLAACAQQPGNETGGSIFGQTQPETATPPPAEAQTAPLNATNVPPPSGNTPEALDTTTEEERKEAVAEAQATGGARALGTTVASLGAVSEPGIWIKTPLVSAPGKGRVDYPAKGTSVAVDLIPLDGAPGAGSRLSLAAMRLLEAELTSLPEVQVFQLP